MSVGDVLEWFAGAGAVTAAVLGTHRVWVGFAAGAVVLAYQAQCYGSTRVSLLRPKRPHLHFPSFRLPRLRRAASDGEFEYGSHVEQKPLVAPDFLE